MTGKVASLRAEWFRRKVAELGQLLERLTPDRVALALRDPAPGELAEERRDDDPEN